MATVTITLTDQQTDDVVTQSGAKQQIADLTKESDDAKAAQAKAEALVAALKASIAQAGY